MAAWVCAECSTTYSVGAPRCPHCHSTDYLEEGAMPKITVHGGPTGAEGPHGISATWGDEPYPETAGAVTEPPASTAPAPDRVLRIDADLSEADVAELRKSHEGGASSPGSSSSASSKTSEPSSEPNETAPRSRARKTASHSKKAPTADSSAPSTAGDLTADTSDD